MADQNIREIQVSAKQLVFLFMASVVLAVAVFLLGVSVGRGVREKTAPPTPTAETAAMATPGLTQEPMPPPTPSLGSAETKYAALPNSSPGAAVQETPKGGAAVPATTEPPEVSEPAGAAPKTQAAPVVPVPAAKAEPAPKPAPAKPADLPAPPKPGSGWSIQINAFRSRENADNQVASLKAKGYPAFVAPAPAGGLFRVRVGPYPDRADADRTVAKLKQEGFTPSVTR